MCELSKFFKMAKKVFELISKSWGPNVWPQGPFKGQILLNSVPEIRPNSFFYCFKQNESMERHVRSFELFQRGKNDLGAILRAWCSKFRPQGSSKGLKFRAFSLKSRPNSIFRHFKQIFFLKTFFVLKNVPKLCVCNSGCAAVPFTKLYLSVGDDRASTRSFGHTLSSKCCWICKKTES